MAYSITKIDGSNHSNRYQYLCDTSADINNLPTSKNFGLGLNKSDPNAQRCSIGSTALCLADSSHWILGHDDVWHTLKSGTSGGSSSGTVDDLDVATDDEVTDMLNDVFPS